MSIDLQMKGPYGLDATVIDAFVTKELIGNYALGYKGTNGVFIIKYVGRSDSDLNARLKDHIGEHDLFMFSYANNAKEAYNKECKNYHACECDKYLDNKIHPDRPKHSILLRCPICGQ